MIKSTLKVGEDINDSLGAQTSFFLPHGAADLLLDNGARWVFYQTGRDRRFFLLCEVPLKAS